MAIFLIDPVWHSHHYRVLSISDHPLRFQVEMIFYGILIEAKKTLQIILCTL